MEHRIVVLCLCGMLSAEAAVAQEYMGVVVAVPAGDRVSVRTSDSTVDLRLAGIAAPESGNPLAAVARESLATLCLSQAATVVETGTALDGSKLGYLTCAGKSAGEQQVRRGLATVQPALLAADSLMQDALREAQREQRGIWNPAAKAHDGK